MIVSILLLRNKEPQNPNHYWVVTSSLFVKHLNMEHFKLVKFFTSEPLKDKKIRFTEVKT